jgi:predicted O-methyltransferase YrrM
MEHFYQNIYGWFSYDYIYKDLVEQADDDSLFVEIGSFQGRSTAFMCIEIANSGKKIRFECIDPMSSTPNYELSQQQNPQEWEGYGADKFHERLSSVKDFYTLHQMSSVEASKLYEDNSIDFIMIDGDHSYKGVYNDVKNFLPKMRNGGLMTGDDAFVPEIVQAVKDAVADSGRADLIPEFNGIHFFISMP